MLQQDNDKFGSKLLKKAIQMYEFPHVKTLVEGKIIFLGSWIGECIDIIIKNTLISSVSSNTLNDHFDMLSGREVEEGEDRQYSFSFLIDHSSDVLNIELRRADEATNPAWCLLNNINVSVINFCRVNSQKSSDSSCLVESGYFWDSKTCSFQSEFSQNFCGSYRPCAVFCLVCSSDLICSKCVDGIALNNNVCTPDHNSNSRNIFKNISFIYFLN